MADYSIMIPQRDYKLMQQAVKKNRYPVEDPGLVKRTYIARLDGRQVTAVLVNHAGNFAIEWYFDPGDENDKWPPYPIVVKRDMNHISFDEPNGEVSTAHFDIDPTYE